MAIGSNTARTVIPGSEEGSPPTDIISVPEACKFLGVHRNTLYKLIRAGELPAGGAERAEGEHRGRLEQAALGFLEDSRGSDGQPASAAAVLTQDGDFPLHGGGIVGAGE